jgi:hypothetical protein
MTEGPIVVNISANLTGSGDLNGTGSLRRCNTGTTVLCTSANASVESWARLSTKDEMSAHPACIRFLELVKDASHWKESCVLYRARSVAGICPSSNDMGPPPINHSAPEGRYNERGKAVLYLCDSEEGIRRELDHWHSQGSTYIQPYILPLAKLRIADFARLPEDRFETAVFAKAEDCKVQGRSPESYMFSQLVAKLVCSQKFDGMRVPGVRGTGTIRYNNIVVFQPHPDWRSWLQPNAAPYLLSE